MKIIIAGDGKVGSILTRQLSAEGYDITLIDANPKVLESTEEMYDIMAVQGNCATMEVLEQAGVKEADLLIEATSADEVKKVTYRDLCDILKELDQDLVKGALGGAQFKELFYANCKCDKIRAAVEEIVGK